MKRPTSRFRWKPSNSPKLFFSFRELAAIAAFLAFFLACWVLYALHPPPFSLNDTGSSLGSDWDCAPGPYTTACVKRIGPAK